MAEEQDNSFPEEVDDVFGEPPSEIDQISIEYTESSHYRIINADGAQGAFTQNGKFFFKLYSEHVAFPTQTVRELTDEGTLGEIIDADRQDVSIERVMECGVMVDYETLQELHAFLGRQIEILEQISQGQSDVSDSSE